MNQFVDQLRERIRAARVARDDAEARGDSYLADVRSGELESLLRMASDHGVVVDREEVGDPDTGQLRSQGRSPRGEG